MSLSNAPDDIKTSGIQIVRVGYNEKFVILGNDAVRDNRLSLRARGLHHYLYSMAPGWHASIDQLTRHLREGRDAIRNAMSELVEFGYITRTRHQDERGRWSTVVTVYGESQLPSPTPEKPYVGSPVGRSTRRSVHREVGKSADNRSTSGEGSLKKDLTESSSSAGPVGQPDGRDDEAVPSGPPGNPDDQDAVQAVMEAAGSFIAINPEVLRRKMRAEVSVSSGANMMVLADAINWWATSGPGATGLTPVGNRGGHLIRSLPGMLDQYHDHLAAQEAEQRRAEQELLPLWFRWTKTYEWSDDNWPDGKVHSAKRPVPSAGNQIWLSQADHDQATRLIKRGSQHVVDKHLDELLAKRAAVAA